ncbi:MAG: fibronectin type III domain-containing protein [Chloroflexi bacterium]|nr:fibronectin type III domain-containing protein [Chloroflexota bacterium]
MSMMTKRMIRPLLLVLPLLAVLAYGSSAPAAAQGGETLAAPTVTLTAVSACDPENPRTYLVASYTAVEGADSYQYRVKWGRSDSLGTWLDLPSHRQPGQNWPVRTNKSIEPGDVYVVQMRAVAKDDSSGAVGVKRYSYSVGEFPAPTAVTVSYATDDGDQTDYSQARLTWRAEGDSGDWFAVQQRAIGKKWQSGPWLRASTVSDAASSPYYRDVSGLNPSRGYEFRVTGHTPQCEASPWSEVATLWPAPDPPTFEATVGRGNGKNGAMLGVWITDPQENADYHTLRMGDAAPVKMAAPKMQHRFSAQMGDEIELCVSAGNEHGESTAECEAIVIRPDSPFADLYMEPSDQIPGSLSVYWKLKPVINPTWFADDEGSTHSPPGYRVALRRVGVGPDRWPNEDTKFRTVYQEGQKGGVVFDGLEGNKRYEVAVQSNYYGETSFRYAQADTHMYPPSNLVTGFDDEDDGRAVVSWGPPRGGEQTGYTAVLRETYTGKRVGIKRPGREAVSAAFDGLQSGRWYHVTMRAVGLGNVRSTTTVCYFQHGVAGSQNRAGANTNVSGSSCAAN